MRHPLLLPLAPGDACDMLRVAVQFEYFDTRILRHQVLYMAATVTIPDQLEEKLRAYAAERQTTVEQLVREAVTWYVRLDPALFDELNAWQEVRDEALEVAEGSS